MEEIKTTYDQCLEKIVKAKESIGITAKALGKMVGCDPLELSRYIYQNKPMPADIMFALLQALGFRIIVKRARS